MHPLMTACTGPPMRFCANYRALVFHHGAVMPIERIVRRQPPTQLDVNRVLGTAHEDVRGVDSI